MKAKLNLTNPIWRTPERRRMLDKVVQQSAAELEGEIKRAILTGPKTGRVYRRGAAGHYASARGESPAVDTGGLLNSVRAKKRGIMSARVATSKRYAARLDDKKGLDRPFFASTAEKFKPKFRQNILDAIKQSS